MTAVPTTATTGAPGVWARARAAALAAWAVVTGAAPHVLHHVGPLAGTAVVAGAGGRVVFAAAGFLATVPMLRRLHRRTGDWRAPTLALAAFATIFAVSTLVVGPALSSEAADDPVAPTAEVDHHGHEEPADR